MIRVSLALALCLLAPVAHHAFTTPQSSCIIRSAARVDDAINAHYKRSTALFAGKDDGKKRLNINDIVEEAGDALRAADGALNNKGGASSGDEASQDRLKAEGELTEAQAKVKASFQSLSQQSSKTSLSVEDEKSVIASGIGGAVIGFILGCIGILEIPDLDLLTDPILLPIVGAITLAIGAFAGASAEGEVGTTFRSTLGGATRAAGNALLVAIQGLFNKAVTSAQDQVQKTTDNIKSIPGKVKDAAVAKAEQTAEEIKAVPNKVKSAAIVYGNEVAEEIKATPGRVATKTKEAIEDAIDDTIDAVERTVDEVAAIPKKAVQRVEDTVNDLVGKSSTPQPPMTAPPLEGVATKKSPPKAPGPPQGLPSVPKFETPKIEVPKIPKIELPKVSLPKIEVPKIAVPKKTPQPPKVAPKSTSQQPKMIPKPPPVPKALVPKPPPPPKRDLAAEKKQREQEALRKAEEAKKRQQDTLRKAEQAKKEQQENRQKAEEAKKREQEAVRKAEEALAKSEAAAEARKAVAIKKKEQAQAAAEAKEQREEELEQKRAEAAAAAEEAKERRAAVAAENQRKREEERRRKEDQFKAAIEAKKRQQVNNSRSQAAQKSLGQAKPGATISLGSIFGLGKTETSTPSTPSQPSAAKAPAGVPALSSWKQNSDGSITGKITGSQNFSEGEGITTSPVPMGAKNGSVVKTSSGSSYFLGQQASGFGFNFGSSPKPSVDKTPKQKPQQQGAAAQASQRRASRRAAEEKQAAAAAAAQEKRATMAAATEERRRVADAKKAEMAAAAEERKRGMEEAKATAAAAAEKRRAVAEEKKAAEASSAEKRKNDASEKKTAMAAAAEARKKALEDTKTAAAAAAEERRRSTEENQAVMAAAAEGRKKAMAEKKAAIAVAAEEKRATAAAAADERRRVAEEKKVATAADAEERRQSAAAKTAAPRPGLKVGAPKAERSPRGVPVIKSWKKRRDGGVSGRIYGSPNFEDGDFVETTAITKGAIENGGVVGTASGSRYFLSSETAVKRANIAAAIRDMAAAKPGSTITLTKQRKDAEAKAAMEAVKGAKPRATFSLFGLGFGAADEGLPKSSARRPSLPLAKAQAPRGVPTMSRWKKNVDGSITGIISGSPAFGDGDRVTTSQITKGQVGKSQIVTTGSGSRYFLS